MKKMLKVAFSLFVPTAMFAVMFFATPVAGHAAPLGASMASISGGISCYTLAGATYAAGVLAGMGGITLIPALIGVAGLMAFC